MEILTPSAKSEMSKWFLKMRTIRCLKMLGSS